MKLRLIRTACLSSCIVCLPLSQAIAESVVLDNLVVTANKRQQLLSEVNGSVVVRTEEELQRAGVTQLADLEKVFPGLVIKSRGNRAYSNISLRGVTSPDYYKPSVQIYVDGIPQDIAAMTQQLLNVERVELLRGPQGTLYGQNAHGGVINIVTKSPIDTQGKVSTTIANELKQLDLALSTPLGNSDFSTDFYLRSNREEGRIDDISTGDKDIDETENLRGQFRLHYEGESPLSATLDISHENTLSHEEVYVKKSLIGDLNYESATQGPKSLLDRDVETYGLNLNYDFGDAVLTSTTSYQDRHMDRRLSGLDYPEQQQTLSQELRLAFNSNEILKGVIGTFYQESNFQRNAAGFPGFYGDSTNHVDTQTITLFGEATYVLSNKLDITFGTRWSRDKSKIDFNREAPADFSFIGEKSFTQMSPKLSLGWQQSENTRLYATISKGYKPGGFNHSVSSTDDAKAYDTETSTNLEFGWRSSLVDNRLYLTGAIYWIDANDKQIYVGNPGQQVLRNVGDAKSYGVETEINWQATDSTDVNLGVTWGRSTFVDAENATTSEDYDGNRLPYAPDTSINLSVSQQIANSPLPGEMSIYAAARYVDDMFFNESNTLKQDGYTLLDVAVNVDLAENASARLFVDNLTNKQYRTSSFLFGVNDVRSTLGEGRVFGISAELNF